MKTMFFASLLMIGLAMTMTSTSHTTLDFDDRDEPEFINIDFDDRDEPEFINI